MKPTDLTVNDIGRSVVYKGKEEGIITSFNDTYVFVRYTGDIRSKATRYIDLEFSHLNKHV